MDKDILTQIIEWCEQLHSFLSESTDYARGYKDGITRAKQIILEIVNSEN
jgi:hypothetical protein